MKITAEKDKGVGLGKGCIQGITVTIAEGMTEI